MHRRKTGLRIHLLLTSARDLQQELEVRNRALRQLRKRHFLLLKRKRIQAAPLDDIHRSISQN